ncbi:MAG: LemA family protein [Coriobacteriia bacterium]|nr:LemA family protein [Coriobacteriia bacterium]
MWLIGMYNGLVQQDQEVKTQWAQIENQLKRRADLIPNLVETVKGFAAQEKEIIGQITAARAALSGAGTPAEAAEADAALTSALGRLLVVVEAYPNLKSDQTFIRLMDELSGTENRIAVARKDYNDVVKVYNVKVRTFPTNVIAPMFGFALADYFEITDAEAQTPQVDFGK